MKNKALYWVGSAREDARALPEAVRRVLGFEIQALVEGENPTHWKPMKNVFPGAREIVIKMEGQYRAIYVTVKPSALYILHVFQKKTQKTAKRDIELAKARYREIA